MKALTVLPGLLSIAILQPAPGQDGSFQVGAHSGVNSDGTLMLGGQVGLRLTSFAAATVTGSILPTVDGATLTNWDASVRLMPWNSNLRPYFLGGVALDYSRQSGLPSRKEWGATAGAGLEAGRGLLRGFAEARIVRIGTVLSEIRGYTAGRFWAGLRLHFRR